MFQQERINKKEIVAITAYMDDIDIESLIIEREEMVRKGEEIYKKTNGKSSFL
jgi:hypothetical protein